MILGTGHHQPAPTPSCLSANQVGTSTTAAMSYVAVVPGQQGYQSSYMVTLPPLMGEQDQYTEFLALAAVDLAKRGATLHGSLPSHEMVAVDKRKRDQQSALVLGMAHAHQQQTIVVDPLLLDHMWKALAEQRQKHMRLITSIAEDRAAKRLKAKDLEMDLIRGVNEVPQERVRNLHNEAQVWHNIARSKEVVANVLRSDLQCTIMQAVRGHGVDGTSSSRWGDSHVAFCGEVRKLEAVRVGRCKGCSQGKAVVLLLPCSHLCLCASCATRVMACPACECAKTSNIFVNFS